MNKNQKEQRIAYASARRATEAIINHLSEYLRNNNVQVWDDGGKTYEPLTLEMIFGGQEDA